MFSPALKSSTLSPKTSTFSPKVSAFSPQASKFSPFKDLRISRATTVETIDSPYRSRVKSIGKKFNDSQHTMESSSFLANSEQFEARIRNVDEKITDNYRQTDNKLRLYEEEVMRLEEDIGASTVGSQLLDERKDKEFNLVEARITLDLQNEKRQNKESEQKILARVEERIDIVRDDFVHEYRRTEESRQNQAEEITKQISNLQNNIKEEKALREKNQNTLVTSLNQRLTNIRETLASDRKIRQKTEAFLFDKIEEISASLSNQVTNEINTREETESQMLNLLEETCNRYEEKVRVGRRRY